MNFFDGQIIAFDKPYRATSFSVVGQVRRLISKRMSGRKLRVGHAGTLDPLATGVLILCTGRATKMIERLQAGTKEYVAEIALGATTPSFDLETQIDATFPTEHITEAMVRETLPTFMGEIMQVPPAFSACKVEGKRAYEMARKGEEVVLRAKPLRIDAIELLSAQLPHSITIRVVCSKGTYIRALARDIGLALGTGAHLTALQRTRIGDTDMAKCWTVEQFETWLDRQTIEIETPDGPIPKDFPQLFPEVSQPHSSV